MIKDQNGIQELFLPPPLDKENSKMEAWSWRRYYDTSWGISHWLSLGLGSDSKPSLSWATSVNTLQLGSGIPSLHSKSELNLVHTRGSGSAQLRLGSEISEPSPEPSQCEMPPYTRLVAVLAHKELFGKTVPHLESGSTITVPERGPPWRHQNGSTFFFLWV